MKWDCECETILCLAFGTDSYVWDLLIPQTFLFLNYLNGDTPSFHRDNWLLCINKPIGIFHPHFPTPFPQIIALYTVLYLLLTNIYFGCSLTYLYNFLFFFIKISYPPIKMCDISLKNKSTVNTHPHTTKLRNSTLSYPQSLHWILFFPP